MTTRITALSALAVGALIALGGCTDNQGVNAATGAVVGGLAGDRVGGTTGAIVGAGAGAAVGANTRAGN